MRASTILILIALVAGLGLVLWFTSEKPPMRTSAEVSALDGRSLLQCKRLRWQFPDQPAIELVRGDDGAFRLAEPIVDRASTGFARQIVSVWDSANLVATEYADDADGRRETGLSPPQLTFLAEWSDGHRVDYDLGGPGPLGTDRFLRRDGKIWRGGNGLYESMRVNLDDLRDRQVFLHREVVCQDLSVEALAATGKRETLHLERVDNAWRLLEPVAGRAQPAAAVQFVTAVLSLRADEFLVGMVRLPERVPDVVVKATGAYGTEKLELWIENGAAFGQLPGRTSWFQSDPRNFESVFDNASNRLRARALVGFTDVATELAEMVIDPGQGRGDRVRLVRESVGTAWRLVEPVEHEAHATPVNELVQAINNLRAVEFVDDKRIDDPELGLGAGRLVLSVRGFEQREAMNLWFGADVERNGMQLVYGCRADETGTVVLVPEPAIERCRRDWMTYCAREVLQIPVQIERLELSRPDGGGERIYRLDPERGHWVEDGKPERRDEVMELVNDDLRDLLAKSVIDLRGDRLGTPDWIITLRRGNRDVLQTVRAWDRGADQPVVLQPERFSDLGFEIGVRTGKQLRELWK